MQKWRKIGKIFEVTPNDDWMISHSAVPTVELLGGTDIRVYFSTRNQSNQSSIAYFDCDIKRPERIKRVAAQPILRPGALGAFDDSGVMASWIVNDGNKQYLYYIGWNLGVTVPFRNFIGLAEAEDGGEFNRFSPAPLADRDRHDPFFFTNPCVLKEDGLWKMWYLSTVKWVAEDTGEVKHYYHIKYDESSDGIHWRRQPSVAIDFCYDNEYAISRPSVLHSDDLYHMWYSHRASPSGENYRIGYAESKNGIDWQRHDDWVQLDTSADGWDSDMIEYPCVFDLDGARYMLYNGNEFGKSGIGLAVLEQS